MITGVLFQVRLPRWMSFLVFCGALFHQQAEAQSCAVLASGNVRTCPTLKIAPAPSRVFRKSPNSNGEPKRIPATLEGALERLSTTGFTAGFLTHVTKRFSVVAHSGHESWGENFTDAYGLCTISIDTIPSSNSETYRFDKLGESKTVSFGVKKFDATLTSSSPTSMDMKGRNINPAICNFDFDRHM